MRIIVPLASLALAFACVASTSAQDAARTALGEPGISPDGSEIAFVANGSIWSVPSGGGDARLLVTTAGDPARPLFSPDGGRIAFLSSSRGLSNVFVASLEGGTVARVTSQDTTGRPDAWSPDGKYLYFDSIVHSLQFDDAVDRIPAAGGTAMHVLDERLFEQAQAAPSPDGARLAYRCGGFDQWWRRGHAHIDESAICVRTLGATPHDERVTPGGAVEQWPMWSPDGKKLYYVSDRDGTPNLYAIVPGSSPERLTHFTSGRLVWPTIDRTGTKIAFERNFGIWTYDIRAASAAEVPVTLRGTSEPVAPSRATVASGYEELAVAPDGKKLAFVVHGRVFVATTGGSEEARAVTEPGARARELAWDPSSLRIAFTTDREGPRHVALYDFAHGRGSIVTHGDLDDDSPIFSPDGKRIAYVRNARELHVATPEGGSDIVAARGRLLDGGIFHAEVPFAWAPAGDGIAYLAEDERGFLTAHFARLGGEDRQLSFVADANADDIAFSPDGKRLFYIAGQRTEPGVVVAVDLVARPPRFHEDKLRSLFVEQPPKPNRPEPNTSPASAPEASPKPSPSPSASASASPKPAERTTIDYDGIEERSEILPVGLDAAGLRVAPDGKSLLLIATVAGERNLYSFSIDDLEDNPVAVALTTTAGAKSYAQFGMGGETAYYLDRGTIAAVGTGDHRARALGITATIDSDFERDKMQQFDEVWGVLDEFFNDPHFSGVDWPATKRAYRPYVLGAHSPEQLVRLEVQMVGELDASHSGVSLPPAGRPASHGQLAIDLDPDAYARDGEFRIARVVANGPADLAGLKAGDVLLEAADQTLHASSDLDALLDGTIGKRVAIAYRRDGARKTTAVLPIDFQTANELRLRAWIAERRAIVARASGGKLGYVYLPDMGSASFDRLIAELDTRNQATEGVVIDVRNNDGGFIDPYVIDVLSRRDYLNFTNRNDRPIPARAELGQRALGRKTVLLVDEHSLSDSEDLAEGYRALHLGKIVGEPTSGWIIFTSDIQLFDGTRLRVPQVRVTTTAGGPLELHPRPVDVTVARPLDADRTGNDAQLEAAVKTLLSER